MTSGNMHGDEGDMIAWLNDEQALHQPVRDSRLGDLHCAVCLVPYPCEFADSTSR